MASRCGRLDQLAPGLESQKDSNFRARLPPASHSNPSDETLPDMRAFAVPCSYLSTTVSR